ncbi:MAG: DUF86 domain-containing protein [Erysipelotrichaceae bacterium]|nr:DUF86 domain-containing protein [Erysipelotrichaceae bacterium]MDY5252799.1 HepT-like ribonuclease domain-containing protein [Erysipelotrichaceae bacterium]
MDNIKNDEYYVNKMKKNVLFITSHMDNVSLEELQANEILLDSMLFRMIQISECAKKLSEDYKDRHKEVPWYALSGMRNRIVHDYGTVDLTIIYYTLKDDIPNLLILNEN